MEKLCVDDPAFDRLAQAFAAEGSRRGLLGLLTALPLVTPLVAAYKE
jgi:hypothetical protein